MEEELRAPTVVTPQDEFKAIMAKLDEIDDRVSFVLGEVTQREGLKFGTHIGFIYGLFVGLLISIILKFVLNLL
ncbi:MAG: tetrahydromethanopterin S-methyltransferase subunit G [Candidatus Methanomethylicota archaeon]|uniref:Tetrahydromethanopterin S-methyltransferase subunit G n=1 Tax=Thermoproteota archaeon TaxID=2056631 RepID=A0A497EQ88_9CREN|nr:MAG: tetrahydromethanopterin S-methyltransferase subunit G [Candidatus Verstraetearchaeota archaeon]RLE50488.1 MAG: tetrahydromethanopterin S-methyltransferase subunit G [Candidatus Verstraetearchaeota archaeon]